MILLDLNMKDMNGVEVLKAIKNAGLDSRVIMLTVSDQAEDLVAALQAGADGYLLKDMEPEDLMASLVDAAHGKIAITDRLTQLLAVSLRERIRPRNPDEAGLTDQESRILEQIAEGKSNKLIAKALGITEGTVKVHVKHLLKKLNLRSRVEAAVWADRSRRQA
jgi:two-component system nitrate/nitrite response regulator NarL